MCSSDCADCGFPFIGHTCRICRMLPTKSRDYLRQLYGALQDSGRAEGESDKRLPTPTTDR
jgi:hypothetical protein